MDTGLIVVCFTGGTCGDLIVAMIDPDHITVQNNSIILDSDRSRLKKPHSFNNEIEKNQYLNSMSLNHKSIPSHDLEYHVQHGHKFITITVHDYDVALWAANRFKKLHRPHVWQEMQNFCGAKTIGDYAQTLIDYSNMVTKHTDQIIKLESIKNGHATQELSKYVEVSPAGNEIYQTWLGQHGQ